MKVLERNMKKIFVTLLLCSAINFSYSQINEKVSNKLIEELENIYSQGHINGYSAAIVNQNNILFSKGFGYANTKQNIKYTENTIQNIGSISKTFIGVALLKAQELRKLNLDDPINKYLPFEVKNPYYPDQVITIRHLTTHTSSIKDGPHYEKKWAFSWEFLLKDK